MKFLGPLLLLIALGIASLFAGVSDLSLVPVLSGDERALLILIESRVPRTLALVLAGAGMAVSGTIMQMLARNRFVEPSTAGTVESAGLGILVALLFAPDLPVFGKMLVATGFALLGTSLFLLILRQVPLRTPLMVPLIGIMLGGVISAMTTFIAYRADMLQSLGAVMTGDFSSVLRGRYELLWMSLGLTLAALWTADRFTVMGLGQEFATNLGLAYGRILTLGLVIVSVVTACVVVTVGMVPFVGLMVPNIVSIAVGDNLRRSLPLVACLGAGLVLACDIVGRIVIPPFEIPVGAILGVVGSVFFLFLILRKRSRVT